MWRARSRCRHRLPGWGQWALCVGATLLIHVIAFRSIDTDAVGIPATRKEASIVWTISPGRDDAMQPIPFAEIGSRASSPAGLDDHVSVVDPGAHRPGQTPPADSGTTSDRPEPGHGPEDFLAGDDLSVPPTLSADLACSDAPELSAVVWRIGLTVFVNQSGRVPRIDVDDASLSADVIAAVQNAIESATFTPAMKDGRPVNAAVHFEAVIANGRLSLTQSL